MITDLCQRGHHGNCWDEACECTDCHFVCSRCVGRVKKLTDGICAPCYRAEARTRTFKGTACDDCGGKPAFRNPGHRRNEYLCLNCQLKRGESLPLRAVDLGAVADCMGKDISDPAHRPVHIRGNRWQCTICKCTLQRKDPGKGARVVRQTDRYPGGLIR